jgi:hypothetical protein
VQPFRRAQAFRDMDWPVENLEAGRKVPRRVRAKHARDFIGSVIRFSESWESVTEGPDPDQGPATDRSAASMCIG